MITYNGRARQTEWIYLSESRKAEVLAKHHQEAIIVEITREMNTWIKEI